MIRTGDKPSGKTTDKINAIITARRYPDDPRYHARLVKEEVDGIKKLLDGLQRSVGSLQGMASATPAGKTHNDVIQADLRKLLARDEVDTANIRAGMDQKQVGRFWSFMRGRKARREDLALVFARLQSFAELLSS